MPAARSVKVCPRCRSKNIFIWMGAQVGVIYECKKCGYRGPLVVEEYELPPIPENRGAPSFRGNSVVPRKKTKKGK